MPAGTLVGVRVLDLSRLLPGPFATLVLADLGADVVKIEDPGPGDYLRPFPPFDDQGFGGRFAAVNRDKRSVVLDLKHPDGCAVFRRLCARADVVVESFRPGVLERLGLGYEALAAINPRLVLCSISGYGQTGPYRDRAGHDVDYLALAGVLGSTGPAGALPQLPGVQIADIGGGALFAVTGICAALFARAASGRGRHLDVSMTEGALAFAMAEIGNFLAARKPLARGAELLTGGVANYGVYETSDGRYLAVGALEPKFWLAFNAAIGRRCDIGELAAGPEEQARVRAEVAAILLRRTRAEWEVVFAGTDACVEPVLEPDELVDHPVHRARQVFFDANGRTRVRTPLGEPRSSRPPPRQGQHTIEVLEEAGFTKGEIDALLAAGAIRVSD